MSIYRLHIAVFFVVCLCAVSLQGQPSVLGERKVLSEYSLDTWSAGKGSLPSNSVKAISQSNDGYLWIATFNGLVRFDGVQFTIFNSTNTKEIRNNGILSLIHDRNGMMWVGLQDGGVLQYHNGIFKAFTTENGLADNVVYSLAEERDGSILVGTGKGINRISNGIVVQSPDYFGFQARINSLIAESNGTIWAGTPQGLYCIQKTGTRRFTTDNGLPSMSVMTLYADNMNALWVGTSDGVCQFVNEQLIYNANLTISSSIYALYKDHIGTLWIGAENGLYAWNNNTLSRITMKDGLSDNDVQTIYEDRENSLWIGTYYGGMNRLKKGKFISYSTREGLIGNVVYSIFETRDGSIWIGALGGAQKFSKGISTQFTTENGLQAETVRSVLEDDNGVVWIGTYKGLHKIEKKKITVYSKSNGLIGDRVRVLCKSRDGSIWIGTTSGVSRYQNGVITSYTTQSGLSSNSILAIFEDSRNRLWFGTDGGGISIFEKNEFRQISAANGLTGNIVFYFAEDERGSVWVCTNTGLNRIRDGEIRTITSANGLTDNTCFHILQDNIGNFWISTGYGILRVKNSELNAIADGSLHSFHSVFYNAGDGMLEAICTTPASPCKTSDGRLWFPTHRGVTIIDPKNIEINTIPPPLVIESIFANAKPLVLAPVVSIEPGAERIEIHYTSLSMLSPKSIRFRYRLEGADQSWVNADDQRIAHYTNLSPGTYTFTVIAFNNDGVWNNVGASVTIIMQPRFYQTIWFYSLCIIAVILAFFIAHDLRVRSMKIRQSELATLVQERTIELDERNVEISRQVQLLSERTKEIELANIELQQANVALDNLNKEKNDILGIVSHDLKNPLSNIKMLSNILSKESQTLPAEEIREFAEDIHQTAGEMFELIVNLLDVNRIEAQGISISVGEVSLLPFLEKVVSSYQASAQLKGITIHSEIKKNLPVISADPSLLLQALDNIVSNAVKYSPFDKHIFLRAFSVGDRVRVEVQDEGPGLSPDDLNKLFGKFARLSARPTGGEHSTGLGLSIVKKLVTAMGANVWCESKLGNGATFILEFPVHRA